MATKRPCASITQMRRYIVTKSATELLRAYSDILAEQPTMPNTGQQMGAKADAQIAAQQQANPNQPQSPEQQRQQQMQQQQDAEQQKRDQQTNLRMQIKQAQDAERQAREQIAVLQKQLAEL